MSDPHQGTDAVADRERQNFRIFDLPAELRNYIYLFVAAGSCEPTTLRQVSKLPQYVLVGSDMTTMSYRMGLAQTCKQLRADYLSVYINSATVAVCRNDLENFTTTNYPLNGSQPQSPKSLFVCICHKRPSSNLFDILPIIKLRIHLAGFICRFFSHPSCVAADTLWSGERDLDESCQLLTYFCNIDNHLWLQELEKDTFKRIDASYIIETGINDIGLELSVSQCGRERDRQT